MRHLTVPAAVMVGALALPLTGCGGSDDAKAELSVSSSYMPQPVSDMAAGFLTIANKGGAADDLTSVTTDAAGSVTIHRTVGQSMEEVKSLDVPAHGQLVFKSGGNHLMFENLKRQPKQGQKVTVELHFAKAGPIKAEIPVKSATYNPATGH